MATRFFANGLSTGMTGSNIDPDLAATLAVAERREKARDREYLTATPTRRIGRTTFSTLMLQQSRSETRADSRLGERPPAASRPLRLCRQLRRVVERLRQP